MNSEPFLKPRLTGARFDGGAIPLEVLGDFAVLKGMIVEIAKWKYREANPSRKRVPQGFTDGITLKLTGIEDGSAVPVIKLVLAASTLLPSPSLDYFYQARSAVVGAIGAAEQNGAITDHLPKKLLGYFDRFGRNLEDGEAIEFTEEPGKPPVHLNKETRRKLVLASSVDEVTEEIVLHGAIPEMDQQANSFQIRRVDGTKVKAPLTNQHFDTVMEAFNNYKSGIRVRMYASGQFDRSNQLRGITSVEQISILDPLDLAVRVEELSLLRHGWFDGKGIAPDHEAMRWLLDAFGRYYSDELQLPYLYPTAEGGVRAEWSVKPCELSLDIDFKSKTGAWHTLNLENDEERSQSLNLGNANDWKWLNDEVRRCGGMNS